MSQETINERIKFLIEALGMSARGFSLEIGSSDTNTRNYLDRGSKPGADYLERIVRRFEAVNGTWLLTGQGDPFLMPTPSMEVKNKQDIKKNKGDVQANTGKTINHIHLDDCQKELTASKAEVAAAQNEIKLLREQLAMQATVIAAKDETISLLRASYTRPN